MMVKLVLSLVWLGSLGLIFAKSLPPIIPAVHTFNSSSGKDFTLPSRVRIVVDAAQASSRKDSGLTLIPPSLEEFAQTFSSDIEEIFPHAQATVVHANLGRFFKPQKGDIIMTIISPAEASKFTLAKGVETTEGYEMDVTATTVTISGAGAKGAFWGTRTFLQGLILGDGTFPAGSIQDQPDWQTRGIMLDVGRQWYPITFLTELCAYASWFKASEFHVHLSDNVPTSSDVNAYARFRLESQFSGLTPHVNETYSRDEFEAFQQNCAARGVTVIPEFESPGHALVINQWKPELALTTDITLLNLSVPETIPTVKSIWQEFLPRIHSKQVSIGADEYNSKLAVDYDNFVNTMSDFIGQSGKSIRIWGTAEPSNTTSVSLNITQQHWEFADDDPFGLIREGYHVINSDDAFNYIVMKLSGSYPQMLNETRLWHGANVNLDAIWDPHIFDRGNASNNPDINEPLLEGSIMAVWNDNGRSASTYLEAFYSVKRGLPITVSAGWQSATRPNHLTEAQFDEGFTTLELKTPGQNLNRLVPSKGAVVVEYNLSETSGESVRDESGNGYTGKLSNGIITTPLSSKGHNYTLLLEVTVPSIAGNVLSGFDDTFGFAGVGGGLTLAFNSTNITYPLRNYTLPSPSSSPIEIVIAGTERSTSAFVNGQSVGSFVVAIGNKLAPMAFVAPLHEIGMSGVTVSRFMVWDGLQDIATISAF